MTQAEKLVAEAAEQLHLLSTVKTILQSQIAVLTALGRGESTSARLIAQADASLTLDLTAMKFELEDAKLIVRVERMNGEKRSVSAETDADTRRDERLEDQI